MRTWLQRLWDYLRRFTVGDDEGISQGGDGPTPRQIGEDLQDFFLQLFQGDNLRRFQEDDRQAYVDEYIAGYSARRGRDLSDDAMRLINSPDLREIERFISEIQSTPARLLYVVCPPM